MYFSHKLKMGIKGKNYILILICLRVNDIPLKKITNYFCYLLFFLNGRDCCLPKNQLFIKECRFFSIFLRRVVRSVLFTK